MKINTIEEIKLLKPCKGGLNWALKQQTLVDVWDNCPRSDWMWWLLQKLDKCPKELSIKYSKWCADSVAHLKNAYASASASAAADVYEAIAAGAADVYAAIAASDASADAAIAADAAACAAATAAASASAASSAAYSAACAAASVASAAVASAAYSPVASVGSAAAAAYSDAGSDARNISRQKQADYLRSIVENPFL